MCHPWLAAGVTTFLVVVGVRELGPLLVGRGAPGAANRDGLLGARLRTWFRARTDPLAATLLTLGVSPDHVTVSQLLVGGLCGLAYAAGWIFTAGCLLLASGTIDVLDGAMARKRGPTGPRGAYIDSVVDRYGEFLVFAGLAVRYRSGWTLWAVLAALFGGLMVSYTRARAEALGADCRIGLGQRPERYVILGGGSILSALAAHGTCSVPLGGAIVAASVAAVAFIANLTALQRIVFTLRRLT